MLRLSLSPEPEPGVGRSSETRGPGKGETRVMRAGPRIRVTITSVTMQEICLCLLWIRMEEAELANKTFIDVIWIKLFEAGRDGGLQNFKERAQPFRLKRSTWKWNVKQESVARGRPGEMNICCPSDLERVIFVCGWECGASKWVIESGQCVLCVTETAYNVSGCHKKTYRVTPKCLLPHSASELTF